MLHAIEAYIYRAKKLNTRIFEVSLWNDWYLPSYLNAGYKQMVLAIVSAFLLCFQFSCVFPFLIMLSSHTVTQKIYTNNEEAD